MYEIISLTLKNYVSHTNSKFCIKKGLSLLIGENEDDKKEGGADSNGSGKSAIFEAITFTLTGESYKDVPLEDLIQFGKKDAQVQIVLKNQFETFTITRIISGSGSKISLESDVDNNLNQITSVSEANKEIQRRIGINKEDLLNYYIINQGSNNSFLTTTDAKQKEIISRFLDYKSVETVISNLSSEVSKIKTNVVSLSSNRDNTIENIEEIKTEILRLEGEVNKSIEKETEPFLLEWDENDEKIKQNEISITSLIKKNKELTSEAEKETKKLKSLEDRLELEQNSIDVIESQINKKEKERKQIENKLQGAICCPNCNHSFILGENENVDELKARKEGIVQNIAQLRIEIDSLEQIQETTQSEYNKVVKSIKTSEITIKIAENRTNKSILEKENEQLKDRNEQLKKKCEALLEQTPQKEELERLKSKLDKKTKDLEIIKIELEEKTQQIEDKEYAIHHLGKKGFLTFLANKCIKVIESNINHHLGNMLSNLRVKIQGYTTLSSGELRDKIFISISKSGMDLGRFNKFSGGQKGRVNMSSILALQSMFNSILGEGKGLNFIGFDESLDYLDEYGQRMCLKTLQGCDITCLVVTQHKAEYIIQGFNSIVVKYKNGESSIYEKQ